MKRERKISISHKIIMLLVIIVVLPTAFLGVISYSTASNITENEIRSAAIGTMNGIQENINSFIHMKEENLLIVSQNANIRHILNKKPEEMVYVQDVLKSYTEGHEVIMSIYVGRIDKKLELYPEQELPAGFDPTTRPWYLAAISKNGLVWTEPYVDAATGKLVVTLAIPLYNDSKELMGVLGADISLEKLSDTIGDTKIGNEGYIFLLDSKGIVLTHPDKTLIGKEVPVPELKQEVATSESGNMNYTYNNSRRCAYYSTLNSAGWKILGNFEYSEITDKTNYILLCTPLLTQIANSAAKAPIIGLFSALLLPPLSCGLSLQDVPLFSLSTKIFQRVQDFTTCRRL
jgi:methyl-accepting chemotaxis protein